MGFVVKEINKNNFRSRRDLIGRIGLIVYSFESTYPEIKTWFLSKVNPGLKSGERSILYVLDGDKIVGLSILKDSELEKKICTFYISPEARGKGLADVLFKESFTKLNTEKPIISVPEHALQRFNKYIVQYQFYQTESRFLNSSRLEFVYNGR